MEFKIKRDFIPIFLFNAFLLLIAACSVLFFSKLEDSSYLAWFIIVLTVDVLALVLYNNTVVNAKCYLTEDTLVYKRGFTLKYNIPLNRIAKVTEVKNLYPSLSLSTSKLRILIIGDNGKQCVYYISVADNKKLMSVLKVNPSLKNVKDELETPADKPIEEEPKTEVKEEEIVTATNKKVVAKPKTTAKAGATTKKPAAKKPATKKTTSTTKKAN